MGILEAIREVKGFVNYCIVDDNDHLLVYLEGGKMMKFHIEYDEDLDIEVYCYHDAETGEGIESCNFDDIVKYSV